MRICGRVVCLQKCHALYIYRVMTFEHVLQGLPPNMSRPLGGVSDPCNLYVNDLPDDADEVCAWGGWRMGGGEVCMGGEGVFVFPLFFSM